MFLYITQGSWLSCYKFTVNLVDIPSFSPTQGKKQMCKPAGLCGRPPSTPVGGSTEPALPFLSSEQCRHLYTAGTFPAPPSPAPDGCAWPPPPSEPDIPPGNRTPPGSQKNHIISKPNGFFETSAWTTSHLVSNSRNRGFLPSNWNSTGSFMGITWVPNR